MGSVDPAKIVHCIDVILGARLPDDTERNIFEAVVEQYQGTLTLVTTLYGAGSHQAQTLLNAAKDADHHAGETIHNFPHVVLPVMRGTLRAMRADVGAGLVGNIERRAAGELLGDFLTLARDALATGNNDAKNVAAVICWQAAEGWMMATELEAEGGSPGDRLDKHYSRLVRRWVVPCPRCSPHSATVRRRGSRRAVAMLGL